jgi:hypothetical protein
MPNPNTTVIPTGNDKFTLPPMPTFSGIGPVLSALSLLAFFVVSVWAIIQFQELPLWALAPFAFAGLGSLVGFLYESYLLAVGRAYQLFGTPAGLKIQKLRGANLPFVFGSAYLAFCLTALSQSPSLTLWIVAIIGVIVGVLMVIFLFQGLPPVGAIFLAVGLVGQLLLLWLSSYVPGDKVVRIILTFNAIVLFSTVLVGAETPIKSFVFHVLGIATVVLLYLGYQNIGMAEPNYFAEIALPIPWLWLIVGVLAGHMLAFRMLPRTLGVLRSHVVNATWPLFYLIVAGGMRIPRPERLSELYKGKEDQLKPLGVLPYSDGHPRNLTHPIDVPCLDEALTLKVHAFGPITMLVTFAFAAASVVNRIFPFANINVRLADKPRMEPWSDGSQYWPKWLKKTIYLPMLGKFSIESGVQGPDFQRTPEKAIEAYLKGQLLAYLVECGIGGSFLRPETQDGKTHFKLDMSFLEQYETKPDYESYGGIATLEINDENKRLELISVRAPHTSKDIDVETGDATFRRAEELIIASLYYYVVSGKHLVEIHMGLNLVEIALFNSFDAKKRWNHPVRMALYPHLFAHELAEELTTQNLIEDAAIFPQIFATTNAALAVHLNDRFNEYQLGVDEDFEKRESILLTGRDGQKLEDVVPHSSLIWEKVYASLWQEYADSIVAAAYESDQAVADDECVQVLFANLSTTFVQELPSRYHHFQDKAGLARFISDTMHHLIIRHEVYGTSGVRLALDPRINKVQVPKDGGTTAIDEWRSLACIAMATSRVRYTKLSTDFSNVFDDIDDEAVRDKFKQAHSTLKQKLDDLEKTFTEDGVDNYQTLRLLPSDLDIGAGY